MHLSNGEIWNEILLNDFYLIDDNFVGHNFARQEFYRLKVGLMYRF